MVRDGQEPGAELNTRHPESQHGAGLERAIPFTGWTGLLKSDSTLGHFVRVT